MTDGVGLSVGATSLAAVVIGRAAVSRTPVLTRFAHRPPEVGVPSENPRLDEPGLILSDFVDRVGDPVGILAADGSSHRADTVLAEALRAMLYTVGGGVVPAGPIAITHPAHWRDTSVSALRTAVEGMPEFRRPPPAPVLSDATAALTALQAKPGLPARGVIALCDFGGTGSSITLVDAANVYTPVAPTVRHTDLSGDLVDQALLTRVINDLPAAGQLDLSGTSTIGSLASLRAQCRGAKERLSTSSVTSLVAELPGHRSEVRLTRNELDEAIRGPVAEFADVLQETLERNGIRALAAIALAGGSARIPLITTTLSERFRVPVITDGQPELAPAIGGGLAAARGTVEEGKTTLAPAAPAAAAAAGAVAGEATQVSPAATPADAPQSSTFRALAWSDADDVPEVATTDPYDYAPASAATADVRPSLEFAHDDDDYEAPARPGPWYRRPEAALGAGVAVVLLALGGAVAYVMSSDDDPEPTPASTAPPVSSTTTAAPSPPAATSEAPPPAPATQAPPPRRTVTRTAPPPVATVTQDPSTPVEPPPSPIVETNELTEPPPPPPPDPVTNNPWVPEAPYSTVPGLPWVPAPPQLPGVPEIPPVQPAQPGP